MVARTCRPPGRTSSLHRRRIVDVRRLQVIVVVGEEPASTIRGCCHAATSVGGANLRHPSPVTAAIVRRVLP